MMKFVLVFIALVAATSSTPKNFNNYQVWRVIPQTSAQVDLLHDLSDKADEYLFWSDVTKIGQPVDMMVAPEKRNDFFAMLNRTHIDHELFMDDVQRYVEGTFNKARAGKGLDWNHYGTLDEVHDWLRKIADEHQEVELVEGGVSYEGRKVLGVKVSYSKDNAKRGVFLEGGIHAREWISSATVTYMLNEILTSKDPAVRSMAESYDWYVFPNVNPDGYVYTFEEDRMWRKTRTPYGAFCYGADPNRNWGFQWNSGGASSNPCSETYAGKSAFSEVEMKTLSEYIATIADNLVAYIAHHSYSQLLLLPYGTGEKPDNFDELYEVGKLTVKKLKEIHGTSFTPGNIVDLLYVASGGSMDWVKGTFNTRIAYTYELRDTGRYGFLLPDKYIIPSGEEILAAMVTMLNEFEKRS